MIKLLPLPLDPTLGVSNVVYALLIGWFMALVYTLVGLLMLITVVGWRHGKYLIPILMSFSLLAVFSYLITLPHLYQDECIQFSSVLPERFIPSLVLFFSLFLQSHIFIKAFVFLVEKNQAIFFSLLPPLPHTLVPLPICYLPIFPF